MKYIKLYLCTLSLIASFATHAVILDSIFEAQVPVSSQSTKERQQVLERALEQVLVKVSGNQGVKTLNLTSSTQAASLVQQYSYQKINTAMGDEQLVLIVKFNSKGVEQVLKQANQAIWGKSRPLVLTWMVLDERDTRNRSLIGSDSDSWIPAWFTLAANERGLPVMMPSTDLEDLSKVSVSDVSMPYPDVVKDASKRYESDALLMGKVFQNEQGQWFANWTLVIGSDLLSIETNGSDLQNVLQETVNEVTDLFASRYAVLANVHTEDHLSVTVSKIYNVKSYAKVQQYLEGLTPVQHVKVTQVNPSVVVFDLKVIGGEKALAQAISLSKTLKIKSHNKYEFVS